jgi:competence protein ComEC
VDDLKDRGRHDYRMPALGAIAWLAALAATRTPGWIVPVVVVTVSALVLAVPACRTATVLAWLLLTAAVAGGVALRVAAVADSPVVGLARSRAVVTGVLEVRADPMVVTGRFGSRVMIRGDLVEVTGRGFRRTLRAPVLVFGPTETAGARDRWRSVRYRSRIGFRGRLGPALDSSTAAVVSSYGSPRTVRGPPAVVRAVDVVREGIRDATERLSPAARGLVPALVDGDESRILADLRSDFQVCSLTHLLAVSGSNLVMVIGCLLLVARWIGVRARALTAVGFVGIVGFVLLARAEPSVLRAAAMGTVALLGFGSAGRQRGPRALGACVVALMMLSPSLAIAPGFVLSVLATAGIIFVAPAWAAAMRRWLPLRVGWLAEAIAVPTAAQLACTPVVAVLSGQISLVAVPANMLAAVTVAPATIIGLASGLLALLCEPAARVLAIPGGWSADWIVAVARWGAHTSMPAATFTDSALLRLLLIAACLLAVPVLGRVFARPAMTVIVATSMVLVVVTPVIQLLPHPGWPAPGWVLTMCDVGQGDGYVLRVGEHTGVVVDTGPDPRPMDSCLHSLGVTTIPLIVLTHFHADHIGGLSGVLDGRRVEQIEVSPYAVPEAGAARVRALAADHHVPLVTARYGETQRVGPLTWQVLAPSEPAPAGSDSPPNDDSIVMYLQTAGISLLLMGDEETDSQRRLHELFPGLRADVLKVAHHGSAKQDPDLVHSLGARVGLISVGRDNDYGHPAPSLLTLLHQSGIRAYRTDRDGALAIVVRAGRMSVVTKH